MAYSEGPAADRAQEPDTRQAPRAEPISHQRHTVATSMRRAVARRAVQIRELEYHLSPVPAMEPGRGLGDCRGDAGRDHGGHRPL